MPPSGIRNFNFHICCHLDLTGQTRSQTDVFGFVQPVHFLILPKITFDETMTVESEAGDSVLDVTQRHDITMMHACGGQAACATCHIILDQESYDKHIKLCPIEEAEEKMLSTRAKGRTETSRLGCQLIVHDDVSLRVVLKGIKRNPI